MKIANILVSDSWGEVNPEALNRGIGGREGALIYLSREWAKMGHEVTSFVNTEKSNRVKEGNGYHEYVPLNLTGAVLGYFPYDVAIAWECPSVFANPQIADNIKLKMCEMQVASFSYGEQEAAELYCDYVAALSKWHKGYMLHSGLMMDEDKVVVFPNGVDISRYPEKVFNKKLKTKPGDNPLFVYSSSPDRGLHHLLNSWPYIRKQFPEAKLKVAYGVKKWTGAVKWVHSRAGEMAIEIERLIEQDGVEDLGKIGQDRLSALQFEADAWLYPLDSIEATETGCITAVENAAAGNPIITTDCDCMESEFGEVGVISELPFDPREYAECVSYVLSDQDTMEDLRKNARKFAVSRDWKLIASRWDRFFREKLND